MNHNETIEQNTSNNANDNRRASQRPRSTADSRRIRTGVRAGLSGDELWGRRLGNTISMPTL